MKHLIRRMAASGQRVSAHVKVGCDCLNIVDDGSGCRLLLNGHETVSQDGACDESFGAVVADLLARIFQGGKGKAVVVVDGGSGGLMKAVANRLGKSIGADKVSVKEGEPKVVEPAEVKLDGAVNMDALAKNIGVLASKVAAVAASIESARDAALMITRKRLVESMWGAAKMQGILDGVKSRLEDTGRRCSKVGSSAEVIAKSAPRLQRRMSSRTASDDGMSENVLIPGISEGYESIRRAASDTVVSIVPIVYIDDAFQKNTTYPATWFCDQDLMDGVSQGYAGILGFLTQVPTIETKVIDPLSFARMQIVGGR